MRYNILCRRVLPDGRGLEECGPNVRFLPRRLGLSNTSVMVADLQAHTNYSFLLEAANGVSELAKGHARQYVSLNVTTNQAGTWLRLPGAAGCHGATTVPLMARQTAGDQIVSVLQKEIIHLHRGKNVFPLLVLQICG